MNMMDFLDEQVLSCLSVFILTCTSTSFYFTACVMSPTQVLLYERMGITFSLLHSKVIVQSVTTRAYAATCNKLQGVIVQFNLFQRLVITTVRSQGIVCLSDIWSPKTSWCAISQCRDNEKTKIYRIYTSLWSDLADFSENIRNYNQVFEHSMPLL